MREGWTETTLGEVVDIQKGKKPPEANVFVPRSMPYLTADVLRGATCEQFVADVLAGSCVHLSGHETVLLWDGAGAGDVFKSQPGILASTMAKVQSKSFTALVDGYLYLYLDSKRVEIKSSCRGTTVPHVSPEALKSLSLFLPPLAEQKRIVDVVSSVDAYIDALQQQVDLARVARNAVLHELLSAGGEDWTETTIGSVCVVKGGKRLPKGTPWAANPTAHPYIRATDFRGGRIDTSNLVFVPEEVWPVVARYIVQAGDVLITIAGTIGSVALTPETHIGANLTENAALIRPVEKSLDSLFLHLWLLSDDAQRQISDLTIGTTQQKLGLFRIESIEIQLPPIDEQKRIVEIVSSMDEVIQSTEQAVIDAKALRSGLLSDLLSGDHEIRASYDSVLGSA
jgi:hypothetical protein